MMGATLSRWTMAYFAAALLSLVAAEILMTFGFGFPAAAVISPDTLALVHLVTVGWLSLAMCGALFQFVPVLMAARPQDERISMVALVLLVTGLIALVCGFLQLGGRINLKFPLLTAAAVLLGGGFALVVWSLAFTLGKARPLPLPARFVGLGIASVAATVALGAAFALVLDGSIAYRGSRDLVMNGLPIHIIAGLGGWLTVTAAGVSYRLLAMFMLSPDVDRAGGTTTLRIAIAAVSVAVGGGLVSVVANWPLEPVLPLAMLIAFAALALYARDVVRLYRARKRKALELNSRMAAVALGNLALVAVLSLGLGLAGQFFDYVPAIVFLTAFGWLSGLILAKMYKIVAFLTWLECYGPVLGKMPTPRVQDLVAEGPAGWWFLAFFAAVWIATAALALGAGTLFRSAAFALTIATSGIIAELIKTRRLTRVRAPSGEPDQVAAPHLLYSSAR
jgi:hypothetical protein